jgi:hypothetical protein
MTTFAHAVDRAAINRANSQHSTGPVTESGKARSSLNALSHGLTAESPVLPTEDLAAFNRHVQQFLDEHRPATPTETHLVHDLANTAWRQNRIPLLEAQALSRAANPPSEQARIDFDIVDAHRAIALLGIHGQRLSRQFHKTLEQLLALQDARREREKKDLKDAAAICEFHKHKGLPWEPADDGFVFSKDQVERYAKRLIHKNTSYQFAHHRFYGPPFPFWLTEKTSSASL